VALLAELDGELVGVIEELAGLKLALGGGEEGVGQDGHGSSPD
jgi:hypothetical protein